MTRYRFLLSRAEDSGFLDAALLEQDDASVLMMSEYGENRAAELWREPWHAVPIQAVNDPDSLGADS